MINKSKLLVTIFTLLCTQNTYAISQDSTHNNSMVVDYQRGNYDDFEKYNNNDINLENTVSAILNSGFNSIVSDKLSPIYRDTKQLNEKAKQQDIAIKNTTKELEKRIDETVYNSRNSTNTKANALKRTINSNLSSRSKQAENSATKYTDNAFNKVMSASNNRSNSTSTHALNEVKAYIDEKKTTGFKPLEIIWSGNSETVDGTTSKSVRNFSEIYIVTTMEFLSFGGTVSADPDFVDFSSKPILINDLFRYGQKHLVGMASSIEFSNDRKFKYRGMGLYGANLRLLGIYGR